MIEAKQVKVTRGREASWQYAWKNVGSRATACLQQIDCLEKIRAYAGAKPLRQRVAWHDCSEIEGGEVGCYWLRSWPGFLGGRDFGMKLLRNFLRDFTLDCEPLDSDRRRIASPKHGSLCAYRSTGRPDGSPRRSCARCPPARGKLAVPLQSRRMLRSPR